MGQTLTHEIIPGIPEPYSIKILELIATVSPDEVILFGSRAKGNYREGSDIDLAIKGAHLTLEHRSSLQLKYPELNLPWKLDLVIYHLIEEPRLKEHIDQLGLPLKKFT